MSTNSQAPAVPQDLLPGNGSGAPAFKTQPDPTTPLEALIRLLAAQNGISLLSTKEWSLRNLAPSALGRSVTVLSTPTLLIPSAKVPRGYCLINATSPAPANINVFTSAARTVGGSPYTSAAFDASAYLRSHFFLDITVQGATGTVAVDWQAQDSQSGNYATVRTDVFGGASQVGTYYNFMNIEGVVGNCKMVATVTNATMTFSVSVSLKEFLNINIGAPATNIYIGGNAVNSSFGYPIFAGQDMRFYLEEGAQVWAVCTGNNGLAKIFELQ